jgi:hypothetical protein
MITRINLFFTALLRIPIVNVFALLAYVPVIIVAIFATTIYHIVISVMSIANSVSIIRATKSGAREYRQEEMGKIPDAGTEPDNASASTSTSAYSYERWDTGSSTSSRYGSRNWNRVFLIIERVSSYIEEFKTLVGSEASAQAASGADGRIYWLAEVIDEQYYKYNNWHASNYDYDNMEDVISVSLEEYHSDFSGLVDALYPFAYSEKDEVTYFDMKRRFDEAVEDYETSVAGLKQVTNKFRKGN